MPERVLRVLFLALATALTVGCTAFRPVADSARAGELLSGRYPYRSEIAEEELQYIPNTRIEALALPALAKALPEVRFFRSNLRAASIDYPDVDILVAVSRDGSFAVCPSTLFGKPDDKFVGLLRHAKVETPAEQAGVGGEISRMLALVTIPGEIRSPRLDGAEFSAELWHGLTLWRRVLVGFADGRVASVTLVDPRAAATQGRAHFSGT